MTGLYHRSDPGPRWHGEYFYHDCYGLLPALLSSIRCEDRDRKEPSDRRWLWSADALPPTPDEYAAYRRWARVHAFDLEVSATVLLIGARAGFSPGEFVDFFLGWFGVDIAGDDVPLRAWELAVEEE